MNQEICNYMLTHLKYTFLAWNYHEKMVEMRMFPSLDLIKLQDKVNCFINKCPKLALSLFFKVGTNPKILDILRSPLLSDILARPHRYFHSTDALVLFLDHHFA